MSRHRKTTTVMPKRLLRRRRARPCASLRSRAIFNSTCRRCIAHEIGLWENGRRINQLRAVLLERGIAVPQGRHKLERHLTTMLDQEGETTLGRRMVALIEEMRLEWRELDRRIGAFDDEFAAHARSDEAARWLATIPGIGVLNATALVAAIGTGASFTRARDVAAWLGLVPRQITTGGRPRLVGITKRGNKYLRKLLVHGARAAMLSLATSVTPLGTWLRGLLARVHKNVAVVALANKLARIAWAVLRHGTTFDAMAARA
jgi:transposase